MMSLKGFEYELVIQALKLQVNNTDELFTEYFSITPYTNEYIKDWDILFSNLAFITNYVEKNGYFIKGVIDANALAGLFVDIILNSILLSNRKQHKVKNEILYSNLGTNNNWRSLSRF